MDKTETNHPPTYASNTKPTSEQDTNILLPLPPVDTIQEKETELPLIRYIILEEHDSRFYNRLGFYCAIETVDDTNEKLRQLLKSQLDLVVEQKKLLLEYFRAKEVRYTIRIKEIYQKIAEENQKLKDYLQSKLPEAKTEAKVLCDLKLNLENKFSQRVVEFGKQKVSLVEEAIKAARTNLDSIVENSQKTYEKRFGFNNQALEDNKTAVAARTRQYETLRAQAEKQWQRLVRKMQALGFDGMNPAIGHWLFYLGVSIAMICGAYFFSVFALSKGISDSNLPFFLLKGAANFIHQFFPNLSLPWRLLALLGCLLGVSLAVTFIAWLAWVGLRKLASIDRNGSDKKRGDEAGKNDSVAQFEFASERDFSFELRTKGSDFLRFWLQVLPVLLILGLVFLLVFLTLEKDTSHSGQFVDLDNLDISLTGSVIGALLTLMFAGLFSIYILKVVEPRAEVEDESKRLRPIAQNAEMAVAGVLFAIALFLLFFLDNKGAKASAEHPEVIFTYGMFVLANGYLLGFALRIRSIFGTLHFLERKTIMLARAIRNGVLPLETSLTSKEDKIFKKEYAKIQREIFNLLLLKTQLSNQALGGPNANRTANQPERKPARPKLKSTEGEQQSLRGWLNNHLFFWRERDAFETSATEVSVLSIEEWENRLFPDAASEIEQIGKDLALAGARCSEAAELVAQMEQDKSGYCEAVHDRIRRYEDSINGFKIEIEKAITDKRRELRALARQSDSIQVDIRQGYNLGCWFRGTMDANTQVTYSEVISKAVGLPDSTETTSSTIQNPNTKNE
ncbi:MAG: hypothetical protein KIPDCIKN_02820 [Haliscomenobacter sp.]|jgi:hypothetical protein|nr:hypothetical protein [Haliscomenobacter sp.]